MHTYERALERVLASRAPLATEVVTLELACGRVLREDVRAPAPLPAEDQSAMDGYAVRTDELVGEGPFRLSVVGESRAGKPLGVPLETGACRIFTGAVLPLGSDAVVLQEDAQREGLEVVLRARPRPGENVRRRGEDVVSGEVVLRAGTRLSPFRVSLLASVERREVVVGKLPRVGVLATGSELRAPGSVAVSGTIPESNTYALLGLAARAGALSLPPSIVADDAGATADAVQQLLARCDLLVTVGGVSVGDYDVVRDALGKAGVSLDFWKVAIKPGKPLVLGRKDDCVVLGLPGNPVSAQVTFSLFGLPLLKHLQGQSEPVPAPRRLRLTAPLRQSPGRRGFFRVRVEGDAATPLPKQGSGSLTSMAEADGLAIVHESLAGCQADERVDVLCFADL